MSCLSFVYNTEYANEYRVGLFFNKSHNSHISEHQYTILKAPTSPEILYKKIIIIFVNIFFQIQKYVFYSRLPKPKNEHFCEKKIEENHEL